MAFVDAALAVGSFVGADALGGTAATLIGGGLMGAGAGALYGGLTGGSIGKDALMGGLLGAGGAYGAGAMGLGTDATQAALNGVGATTATTGVSGVAATSPASAGVVNPTLTQAGVGLTPEQIAAGEGIQGVGPNLAANTYGASVPADYTPGSLAPYTDTGIGQYLTGKNALIGGGALLAANAIHNSNAKYGTNAIPMPNYNPLPYQSNFGTYQPLNTSIMKPMPAAGTPLYAAQGGIMNAKKYAAGGMTPTTASVNPVENMSNLNSNAVGNNTFYPQADVNSLVLNTPTNTPVANSVLNPATPGLARGGIAKRFDGGGQTYDPYSEITEQEMIDRMSGMPAQTAPTASAAGGLMGYAGGGSAQYNLGSYSDGGRLLKGPGDGMSDNIPASIGEKQPARLADGEFVVPADVVSGLGNGSTDAGAKHLYKMMDKVRVARTGTKKQGKQIKADKYLPK